MTLSRRTFLHTAAAGSFLAATGGAKTPSTIRNHRQGSSEGKVPHEKLSLLMLGGTGFLGPAIVRTALERGYSVTLFNRGRSNPHLFPELEKLRGDRDKNDLEALEVEVGKGRMWDAVIDTSGYVPTHVDSTASLLADQALQYVFLSSVGAYADHSVPYHDESAPVAEVSDELAASMKTIAESLAHYGAMKARCEKVAEATMPGQVTVIRPGLIVGPGDRSDRFTYWAVRVARGGEVLAPGDGTDPVQFVDVRDLGAWVLHCIEDGITGTFNAASPAGLFTMAELLHGIKGAFVTDARFTWVNADFLGSVGVAAWTHMPAWVPGVGEYAGFQCVKTERAVAAGLRFRPLADTARDTVEWHNETRPDGYEFGGVASNAGITRTRETEVLEAWHQHLAKKGKTVPEIGQ